MNKTVGSFGWKLLDDFLKKVCFFSHGTNILNFQIRQFDLFSSKIYTYINNNHIILCYCYRKVGGSICAPPTLLLTTVSYLLLNAYMDILGSVH